MFFLGQAAHIFLVKIPAVKTRCRAANKPFTWKEWLNCDWNVLAGTLAIGALLICGLDEFLKWKPETLEYIKWFFAAVGAMGSNVVMAKMSQFEKTLNNVIDIKSNIADNV